MGELKWNLAEMMGTFLLSTRTSVLPMDVYRLPHDGPVMEHIRIVKNPLPSFNRPCPQQPACKILLRPVCFPPKTNVANLCEL